MKNLNTTDKTYDGDNTRGDGTTITLLQKRYY